MMRKLEKSTHSSFKIDSVLLIQWFSTWGLKLPSGSHHFQGGHEKLGVAILEWGTQAAIHTSLGARNGTYF